MVPRFNAGLVLEIPVAPDFFFQPGLLYSNKGAKANELFGLQDLSLDYNLGYGITGKAEYNLSNLSYNEDIDFTSEYDGLVQLNKFKPFDFGANVFFGYELAGGLSLQLNTQLGLAEINAENTSVSSEASFKNTGFGISLGYRF